MLSITRSFVSLSTASFDSSHDAQHAEDVYQHSIRIAECDGHTLDPNFDSDILMLAAQLHDVVDVKYKDTCITREGLLEFIESQVGPCKASRVMAIIDSVSYRKQVMGERKDLGSDNIYLHIVSDADKIEAIGLLGVERCRAYTVAKNPLFSKVEVQAGVIEHCHEKLLKLYAEHFIVTPTGRLIAAPLHQEMVDYVRTH